MTSPMNGLVTPLTAGGPYAFEFEGVTWSGIDLFTAGGAFVDLFRTDYFFMSGIFTTN